MSDVFNKEMRSQIMRAVKSKNTKSTELALISLFKENHITGWRHSYNVKGHPDFVFLEKRIAIFVDGCFWHGHDCRNTRPNNNAEYWKKKRERNMQRDKEVTARFEKRGWIVVRIWECELKRKNLPKTTQRLLLLLQTNE
nr:very short patch repair endonuclease [uncultured Oscillibacter sp.]